MKLPLPERVVRRTYDVDLALFLWITLIQISTFPKSRPGGGTIFCNNCIDEKYMVEYPPPSVLLLQNIQCLLHFDPLNHHPIWNCLPFDRDLVQPMLVFSNSLGIHWAFYWLPLDPSRSTFMTGISFTPLTAKGDLNEHAIRVLLVDKEKGQSRHCILVSNGTFPQSYPSSVPNMYPLSSGTHSIWIFWQLDFGTSTSFQYLIV